MEESGGRRCSLLAAVLLLCTPACSDNEVLHPSPCYDFQRTGIFSGRKLDVHFLLFTSKNPTCGQLIEVNTTDSILHSHFNSTLSTKILIHGFRAMGTKPSWIDGLTDAFLHVAEVNVVVVDWISGSTAQYLNAVENMTNLGLKVTVLIRQLLALGASESSIHIIGVSLGAHVGGLVGNFFGGKLGRITGLDPAGYKFTKASAEERLDPGDALFVEAIHTDADNFGIRIPVGHIDYYLNGGKDQPGCPSLRQFYSYLICDHMRAVQAYISSIMNSCPLVGFPCSSYQNFTAGNCLDCSHGLLQTCPRIGLLERGGVPVEELSSQNRVYLMTADTAPFCAVHSVVEVRLQERRSASTTIEISFLGENSSSSTHVKIPKNSHIARGIIAHSGPLCRIHTVVLSFVVRSLLTSLWKSLEKEVIGASFCTSQLPAQPRTRYILKKVFSVDQPSERFTFTSEMMFCLSHNLSLAENTPVTLGLDLTTLCVNDQYISSRSYEANTTVTDLPFQRP